MNALITINLRNYLSVKARASLQAAATRWGCEYVEVTDWPCPELKGKHPWWQKTFVHSGPARDFDRVAVLDGDILIRDDCPSLFDVVPEDHFGAVSRIQPGMPKRKDPDNELLRYAQWLGLKCPPKECHINSGVTVYSPKLHRADLDAVQVGAKMGQYKIGDQAVLSVVMFNSDHPTFWMPYTFNALRAWARPRQMCEYIYHFTKFKPVRQHIEATNWITGD